MPLSVLRENRKVDRAWLVQAAISEGREVVLGSLFRFVMDPRLVARMVVGGANINKDVVYKCHNRNVITLALIDRFSKNLGLTHHI